MSSLPESPQAAANRERLVKLQSLHRTDAGNAEAFALLHGDQFRYDHNRGKWLAWNGRFWEFDATDQVERAALHTARQRLLAAVLVTDPDERKKQADWAFRSESTYALRAMLTSAQSIEGLATRATDYDRDRFLLTVGNGTLDLRTGELRHSKPEDLMTESTDVPYIDSAEASRWEQFLEEIFRGDHQLISFVQRAVGYSLTGDTREQRLFNSLWRWGKRQEHLPRAHPQAGRELCCHHLILYVSHASESWHASQ